MSFYYRKLVWSCKNFLIDLIRIIRVIRYPLYVTIDTNIFDSTGYDLGDDGTLGHLCSYVQSGKIKIVLPLLKINMVLG